MFEPHHAAPSTSGPVVHSRPIVESPSRSHATPRIGSGQLLAGGHELVIEHAGQEYRLRLTRNDKLILTK